MFLWSKGLSVSSYLLWWFIIYVELGNFQLCDSLFPPFVSSLTQFSCSFFLRYWNFSAPQIAPQQSEDASTSCESEYSSVSLNLLQHFRGVEICQWWLLIHVKGTSLLPPPVAKFVSADCAKCQIENMLWDRSKSTHFWVVVTKLLASRQASKHLIRQWMQEMWEDVLPELLPPEVKSSKVRKTKHGRTRVGKKIKGIVGVSKLGVQGFTYGNTSPGYWHRLWGYAEVWVGSNMFRDEKLKLGGM